VFREADNGPMTDFLFATPSFLAGVGRSLDLGGHFDEYNRSKNNEEADRRAMAADFQAVGQDLREAMTEVAAEK